MAYSVLTHAKAYATDEEIDELFRRLDDVEGVTEAMSDEVQAMIDEFDDEISDEELIIKMKPKLAKMKTKNSASSLLVEVNPARGLTTPSRAAARVGTKETNLKNGESS